MVENTCMECRHKDICKIYDIFNAAYLKSFNWNIPNNDFGEEFFKMISKRCVSFEQR